MQKKLNNNNLNFNIANDKNNASPSTQTNICGAGYLHSYQGSSEKRSSQ